MLLQPIFLRLLDSFTCSQDDAVLRSCKSKKLTSNSCTASLARDSGAVLEVTTEAVKWIGAETL
jgi:hypothetical protein